MALGGIVIIGWIADQPALTTFGVGTLSAQIITVLIFSLIAAAHLAGLHGRSGLRRPLLITAAILAALSQIQAIAGPGMALDRLIGMMLGAAADARMRIEPPRPTVLIEFLLLIGALLPDTATRHMRDRLALLAATLALMLGGVVMIGYLNKVDIAGLPHALFVMSFPSTAMVLLLAASVIVWRYRDGWPGIFWTAPEESAESSLAPLLMIMIAIALGFRQLADQGVINSGIADALTLVANMTIIIAVVVPGSQRLAERRRERDELAGAIELAAVMVLDREGVILHWSRGCADLYGWPAELAVGRRRQDLLRSVGELSVDGSGAPDAGEPFSGELIEYHRDGRRLTIDNHGKALRRERDGASVVVAVIDITERNEREAELRASEAEMQAILATVPDAMIVCNEMGVIRACSSTAEALFGFGPDELIGRSILELADEDLAGQDALRKRLVHMALRAEQGAWPTPVRARRADGEVVPVSFVLGDALVGGQRMFVAFGRDMRPHIANEERFHRLQSQLAQAGRLSTMGEMAAALAHELSQPLAATVNFLGAAELTMQSDEDRGRLERAIRSASEQASRASEIIRSLRALISRGEADLQAERITPLIREAAALALLNLSSLGVRLSYDFEDEERLVLCDGVQIQQVLVNLIRNGIDAMTSSGSSRREMIISTKIRGNNFLEIEVRDTGPGIKAEILDSLFSPFATTKDEGLGFGLSICRRIVEAHGGQLSTDTEASGGAIFRFSLPIVDEGARFI